MFDPWIAGWQSLQAREEFSHCAMLGLENPIVLEFCERLQGNQVLYSGDCAV